MLNLFIAMVWLINGFYCKILNAVPRHQAIVGTILGIENPMKLTKAIGAAEVIMGFWVLSRYKPKLNAILQIAVIAVMNSLEYALAPNLLLWGRWNALFAFLFILFIGFNTFILNAASTKKY